LGVEHKGQTTEEKTGCDHRKFNEKIRTQKIKPSNLPSQYHPVAIP
jgi:hypothetical protein